MTDLEVYLKAPCRTLSIPYWKNKNLVLPADMLIIHQEEFTSAYLKEYEDESYFRLIHFLDNVEQNVPDWLYVKTVEKEDLDTVVFIINSSYHDLSVTMEQMLGYTKTRVYEKDLWLIVYDKSSGVPVGCGIADYDSEAKEGILEWIQVLPAYRKRGAGMAIANQMLCRLSTKADFVTVSGKVNNETQPEKLYRRCGFVGEDIWHILRKMK